ncbi:MAG TPA: DUF5916 domain-containing protein [Bacteroidota bacterium]|nr:DUF5916 domain-containing protein [Bacteroidota bacterium]
MSTRILPLPLLFLAIGTALAQSSNGSSSGTPMMVTARAMKAPTAPLLDGDVLNDPAYTGTQVLDGFWQTTPDEGKPSSERTEVRVVYTRDTLYVGVVCYERDTRNIIAGEGKRDSPLDESDSFQMVFDTYRDRQNGFIFATTPVGNEYDAQITNEGELSILASRSGSTGGFNLNWDASWRVKTRISDIGWSAEFAIPFKTLRYDAGRNDGWGVNFQRNIRRRKESAYWAPLPRQYTIYHVSRAGVLQGLELPTRQNLKLVPYVLGKARTSETRSNAAYFGNVGADLKYSITQSLTFDLTLNTDFAQVEVDDQQVNLDRFDLFFPEKRPFFLENAGFFDFGSPGEVELFFSRRIGIHGPTGTQIPIVGGARLSGKVGSTRIGLLDMQTQEVPGLVQANNFAVVRIGHEVANRTGFGAIFVNRQGSGSLAAPQDYNRVAGVDGRLELGEYTQLAGYAAQTIAPVSGGNRHAVRFGISHNSPGWIVESYFTEVGSRFNPEVGFLRRRGYRKTENLLLLRYRPSDLMGLHELRPHISYRGFWDFNGFHETGFFHIDNHWEWKNSWEIHTGINFTREGVKSPFMIYPNIVVPARTYDHAEAQLVLITNQGAPLSLRSDINTGGFFGGSRFSKTSTLRFRTDAGFAVQLAWNRNDVNLPVGYFVTNILRLRLSYYFSPSVFLQSLVQYNDRVRTWSANLRFGWLQTANTGLFIVVNELHDFGAGSIGLLDRNIIIKYSQLFDILD